jgi:Xaa-Pro aminopeptidase
MPQDPIRMERNREAIQREGLSAVICARPENVLLLSGYWPVVGTSVVIVSASGAVALVVPEDEKEMANSGWADEVRTFSAGSLKKLYPVIDAVRPAVNEAAKAIGVSGGKIGFDSGGGITPRSYVAMYGYGGETQTLIEAGVTAVEAGAMLMRLRSVCTPMEIERIRSACDIAATAFESASRHLVEGETEMHAAARIAASLQSPLAQRAGGHLAVMSGERSATAFGAYALSSPKRLAAGELALVHCNSFADGFWTDITRTFSLGEPEAQTRLMYDCILEAAAAALAAIRPGQQAAEVDRTTRELIGKRGFAEAFKHPTGHGVGFAAIDHNALPRLHPASPDVLEVGMVFNVEPGIYIEGVGGMRQCNMVAVTEEGCELLTGFQGELEALVVENQ